MYQCRICDNMNDNTSFKTREMMFGFRDRFTYFECSFCGCLQIKDIPTNLPEYYPEDYYSLSVVKENALKRFIKRKRACQALNMSGFGGNWLLKIWRTPPLIRWLEPIGIKRTDKILDVGCGAGQLLLDMCNIGFTNISGIDPFIGHDIFYDNGVKILKKELSDMQGSFDLITFHHSLEHMADPKEVLMKVGSLLKKGKYTLIRIPLASKYAWRTYGANWVQLDAPRHLFIPTEKSIKVLAEKTGFIVDKIQYDSNSFHIWGSEQYGQDIPLRDERSYSINPSKSIFSSKDIERFEAKARQLNACGDGDQACFYLKKI